MWNMTVAMNDTMKTVRVDLLKAEVDDLVSRILVDDFDVVFGHHDLQHGNILMNKDGEIIFVDFE
jgi:singapore isolate B (sub-type 7) whole genome shotgun sequence assembly, scaffold_5